MTDPTALSMAYKNTFNSEHGQRVLKDLDDYGFFRKPDRCFDPDSQRTTCFNLGKLSIVRYIHDEINKDLKEPKDNKAIHKEI
jgi:hypothetical protein